MNTIASPETELVYQNEDTLFILAVVISAVAWLAIIGGTMGIALIYVLLFALGYLFAQSALISQLRGTATQITAEQFPDLHQRVADCCDRLRMKAMPDAYLLHANGVFNAFATRFLGRNFIVLYSDIVDALEAEPDALNFYIGHELGHLRRKHLQWSWALFPATILPLLGAAYSRAREYTCDLHGLACCDDREVAARGLGALAAGGRRWRSIDMAQYAGQSRVSDGFWMSFHELVSSYPWLVKRMTRLLPEGQVAKAPPRNALAWLLAVFVPNFPFAGGSALVTVAVIGILAAVALPAYQDYTVRAKVSTALLQGGEARNNVANYVTRFNAVPKTLADAGVVIPAAGGPIRDMSVDPSGVIHIQLSFQPLEGQSILLVPSLDAQKHIVWKCTSQDVAPKYLPASCR